jgi:hypothetical protein
MQMHMMGYMNEESNFDCPPYEKTFLFRIVHSKTGFHIASVELGTGSSVVYTAGAVG